MSLAWRSGQRPCLGTTPDIQPAFTLPVLALLAVNALILWPGLDGPLLYDDFTNLSQLIDGTVAYADFIFGNQAGPLGRSVTMATFALNYWLAGELVIFHLKLGNLAIHLLNSVLVFHLVNILLKTKMAPERAAVLALLVMGFWMLSPVNTETVLYVIQRAALLSTTFMLAACIAYVSLRTVGVSAPARSWVRVLALMVLWLLGLLSKENALLLPLILLVIELGFFDSLDVSKVSARQAVLVAVLIGLPLIAAAGLVAYFLGFLDYSRLHFSLAERLYTQPVVLVVYLKDLLLPYPIDFGIYRDDFPIQTTFLSRATLLSVSLLAALLALALLLLWDKKLKYLSAGLLIFFGGHLLESSIFPLKLFFWHRNYFPAIGLFLAIVLGLNHLARTACARRVFISIAIAYGIFLGMQSYTQSKIWSSYEQILIHVYEKHPASQHAGLEIVSELVRQGQFPAALAINADAIAARPETSLPARIQRFHIYCEQAAGMPADEYNLFAGKLGLKQPLIVSSALSNLVQSYQRRQCDFIDFHRLTGFFTSWIDRQLSSGAYSAADLWNIDFYMITLLLMLGEEAKAMQRIDSHIANANEQAALFKAELLEDWGSDKAPDTPP